jgi:GNAT superfamily N-acetyltransferase
MCHDDVRFRIHAVIDRPLRDQLVRLWTEVSNAGGAVGFVPPVTEDEVRPLAERTFDRVENGESRIVIATVSVAPDRDQPVAFGLLEQRSGPLFRHWAEIKRLQVAPARQGTGLGGRLLDELHELAREVGLEQTRLTVRGGTGIERFYVRHGYREIARVPGTVRLGPGDDRDELILARPTTGPEGG